MGPSEDLRPSALSRHPRPSVSGKCIPYELPDGYTSYQDYCKYLQTVADR